MATKNNPGEFDCHANAADDEPTFTLRANDDLAPEVVRTWARRYRKLKGGFGVNLTDKQRRKYHEALACADAMEEWKVKQQEGATA